LLGEHDDLIDVKRDSGLAVSNECPETLKLAAPRRRVQLRAIVLVVLEVVTPEKKEGEEAWIIHIVFISFEHIHVR
jgi:hypothetical protein